MCLYAHAVRFARRRRTRRSQRSTMLPQQPWQTLRGRRPGWARTRMITSCTVEVLSQWLPGSSSMAGPSQRARSTSSCQRRCHEHRHMHDTTPADCCSVLFHVAAETREEQVLPGALDHGACLGSLHTCSGAVPWPLPVWAWKYGTIPDAAPAAACDVCGRHSVRGRQHVQGGTGW